LQTDLFDYALPEELIAQTPADRRDLSRLLVVDRRHRTLQHRHFRDLPEYLRPADCLFRNNARVIPARLRAQRPTGGQVECLLLQPAAPGPATPPGGTEEWWCLLKPGKKLPVGATFGLAGAFTARVREKTPDGLVRAEFSPQDADMLAVANRCGALPLPPYIAGRRSDSERQLDTERYQTVYARREQQVAVAAPTAGLHFTPELLAALAGHGVACADLTLHVGLGTFRPITAAQIEDHVIHRETYEIGPATQQALFAPAGRRIAVGTTAVRTVEHFLSRHTAALERTYRGEADIFIYPPHEFRGVDALVTNFHQPRSTLLCLVASFLAPGSRDGIGWLREIYAEAVARGYRFLSYGDAMLIL
jgi:S-adenosylmethionine:tRNA ribosyltransferase-isomerase